MPAVDRVGIPGLTHRNPLEYGAIRRCQIRIERDRELIACDLAGEGMIDNNEVIGGKRNVHGPLAVIPGLVPGMTVAKGAASVTSWIAGTRPAMTREGGAEVNDVPILFLTILP